MKKILMLLFLSPFLVKAQDTISIPKLPIDSISHKVTFQKIEKSSLTKDQLYSKAKEWFALNFKSANDVIQMDDKESGKLIGKGHQSGLYSYKILGTPVNITYNLNFTINITVKESKYRIVMTDFVSSGTGNYNIEKTIESMISDIQTLNKKKHIGSMERKSTGVWPQTLNFTDSVGNETVSSIVQFLTTEKKDDF